MSVEETTVRLRIRLRDDWQRLLSEDFSSGFCVVLGLPDTCPTTLVQLP